MAWPRRRTFVQCTRMAHCAVPNSRLIVIDNGMAAPSDLRPMHAHGPLRRAELPSDRDRQWHGRAFGPSSNSRAWDGCAVPNSRDRDSQSHGCAVSTFDTIAIHSRMHASYRNFVAQSIVGHGCAVPNPRLTAKDHEGPQ